MSTIGLICHGGAGVLDLPDKYAAGLAEVLESGFRLLRQSGHALEVVVRAVKAMEDNPVFNAGTGAYPTLDGRIEMDAAVMTQDGRFGGVCCIRGVANPVLVAEKVMTETDHLLLCGEGAVEFARRTGFAEHEDTVTERARDKLETVRRDGSPYYPRLGGRAGPATDSVAGSAGGPIRSAESGQGGTVGAVAIDKYGKLAVATSTGGVVGRMRGRIGDTALLGAGIYAGAGGAVCCSGHGEGIMRLLLARDIVDRTATLPGSAALTLAMAEAKRRKVQCAAIGLDARGTIFHGHTTQDFAYGYMAADRLFLFNDRKPTRFPSQVDDRFGRAKGAGPQGPAPPGVKGT